MKKLFALLMALIMLVVVSTAVLAETTDTETGSTDSSETSENSVTSETSEIPFTAEASAVFNTSNGLGTYNADGSIDMTVTLDGLTVPETVSGVSVFMFDIVYDKDMVVPAVSGATDDDGEQFDYTSLVVQAPSGWECFGRIISEEGRFELALWDPNINSPMTVEDTLVITIPFAVNSNAKKDDIVFSFENCEIVDPTLTVSAALQMNGFNIEYAIAPDEAVTVPEGAVSLGIAGYMNDAGNMIYYAENSITAGDYVASYITVENGEDGLNNFAIAVVNTENGEIVYFDTSSDDKSDVVIPAGHYIIGVDMNDTDGYEEFCINAKNGSTVTLYNVNPEAAGNADKGGIVLTNAAFVITDPIPTLKKGAYAVYDYEQAIVFVYDTEVTVNEFKNMFANDVTVLNKNGNVYTYGNIETGMTIDYADGVTIVMLGDVHSDGVINAYDYLLIKRHCFGTYELTGASLLAARLSGGETVCATDYLFVKRHCFGTLQLYDLM